MTRNEPATSTEPFRPRQAFTLVELLMAMALTALLALCVATVAGATSSAWRAHQEAVAGRFAGERTTAYLDSMLRQAQDVTCTYDAHAPGEASVVAVWANDEFATRDVPAGDGVPQLYEMRFLVRDPAASTFAVRAPPSYSALSAAAQVEAAQPFDENRQAELVLEGPAHIPAWMRATTLLGDGGVTVDAATFAVDRAGRSPLVSYAIDTRRGILVQSLRASVMLRLPAGDASPNTIAGSTSPQAEEED